MAAIEVEKRPSETISGETSKWNALANPITYRFQRKDYAFDAIDDLTPGNPIKLKITGALVAAAVNAVLNAGTPIMESGDIVIYVHFNSAQKSGIYRVPSVAFESGGNTFIDILNMDGTDVASVGVATGGYINGSGLANFGVEVLVYDKDDELMATESFLQSADPAGQVIFNASPVLKSFLFADNNLDLTSASWSGTPYAEDTFKEFYIAYRMVWDGSANSYTADTSYHFYAVFAGLNIPAAYGPNMAEYVSFNDGGPLAKWLTKLVKPVMWRGWPFSASCIVGDLAGDFYFTVEKDNANGENTTPADLSNTVQQVSLKGISDFGDDVEEIELTGVNELDDTQVTETLKIEVKDPCSNPVMLLGRNSKGGPLYWLFSYRQTYTYIGQDGKKIKEMVLSADDLTNDQWEALQDFIREGPFYDDTIREFTSDTIKTASQVGNQLYVVDKDGNKVGVTIVPTDNLTNTRKVMNLLELTIRFPEEFLP